jgi:uncharacterized protein (DUF433 family)
MEQSQRNDLQHILDEVVGLLRAGNSYTDIQSRHPHLSNADIKACHEIGLQRMNKEAASKPIYCRLDAGKR